MLQSLLGDVCASTHVFVGAVGAGTDQADLDFVWPAVLLRRFACIMYDAFINILIATEIKRSRSFRSALITQFGDRMSQVGCEGSVYVRLQSGQIQFDDLIVLGVRVRRQQALVLIGGSGDFRASGRLQVILHPVIVREERGGGADLGTHVANGRHSGAADAVDARTEVLHDGTGTALDGEDTGHFQNDVLGTGPTLELARELHADHLRALELPRDVRHNVDGIGAADADAQATKTAAIRRVRIGTDHQ